MNWENNKNRTVIILVWTVLPNFLGYGQGLGPSSQLLSAALFFEGEAEIHSADLVDSKSVPTSLHASPSSSTRPSGA
eukprot:4817457-Amphidinium_carterae.1